jgi:MHS family alpha-ketoglutarate permease-like MFS transporter
VVALYLRSKLKETESFRNNTHHQKGSLKELLRYPKAIATVVGLTLGGTIAFYTYSTYMQKFLVNTVRMTKDESTLLTFLSLSVFAFLQPAFGLLSDIIGRRPLLIGFGVLGTICTVPLLTTLSQATSQWQVFSLLIAALLIVSGYTSINAVVKAELFPAQIRALGVGLPYALTVAIFGGSAEYIALYLKSIGYETWYYYFVTICIFISLLVYITMKDTKHTSLIDTA